SSENASRKMKTNVFESSRRCECLTSCYSANPLAPLHRRVGRSVATEGNQFCCNRAASRRWHSLSAGRPLLSRAHIASLLRPPREGVTTLKSKPYSLDKCLGILAPDRSQLPTRSILVHRRFESMHCRAGGA